MEKDVETMTDEEFEAWTQENETEFIGLVALDCE